MPENGRFARKGLGWEALLLAIPLLALVVFGFLALRWEKRAEREELRARCQALVVPLREDLLERLTAASVLPNGNMELEGTALPVPGEESESLKQFQEGNFAAVLGEARARSEAGLRLLSPLR